MKRNFLSFIILLIIFSSCNNETLTEALSYPAVTLTTVLKESSVQTRINSTEKGNQFETGDIIAVSNGEKFTDYVYSDSIWKPVSGSYLVWKEPVMTFKAYHPSTDGTTMTSFILPTDQTSVSKLSKAEYLISEPTEHSSDSPVTLRFQRKVARVIVNVIFSGGFGDDKVISDLKVASPAGNFTNSTPTIQSTLVSPYKGEANKYYAILIPTGQAIANDLFIKMTTKSHIEYTLNGIPTMQPGKSYTYNVTARNSSSHELEIESVTVDDWNEGIINGYIRRYKVQTTGNDKAEYYLPGDSVPIVAAFKEYKKFSQWSVASTTRAASEVEIKNAGAASTYFIMPNQDVELTTNYLDAPYRLTIKKPGVIMEGNEMAHIALTQETDTTFVRYYAKDDRVDISTPCRLFNSWEVYSDSYHNFYYELNSKGGKQNAATWFTFSWAITSGAYSHVNLTPTYKVVTEPFWDTQKTAKGWLEANFIERVNTNPNAVTIPGGATFYRAFTTEEKAVVMRAMNAIENTFSIAPRRTISVNFAIFNSPASGIGAATSPVQARSVPGYESPKRYWLETDFEGRATGRKAYSSTIEACWRDQENIFFEGPGTDNGYIGFRDGTILVNHSNLLGWYKGEDPGKIPLGYIDCQSVIMHELGHLLCYHSLNGRGTEFTALDVFVASAHDHSKNILNGNMYSNDGGDAIIYNDFVKSYLGYYLEVVSSSDNAYDFGHLLTDTGFGVGSQYRAGSKTTRKFADFELAFLQEMGWKISPAAWSEAQNPVLSKSTDNIQVSGDAGSYTMTVSNMGTGSMKWKMSKTDGWITTISPESGILTKGKSQTVTITYQALVSGDRSATITLSSSTPSVASGNASQTVRITQHR